MRSAGSTVSPCQEPVLLRQVLHGEVDAVRARCPETGRSRACVEPPVSTTRVELLDETRRGEALANVHARLECDTLRRHLVHPSLDDLLFQLELGDAQPQQAAYVVCPLVDGDRVAAPVELLCRGESRGPGAHYGDALARAVAGRLGDDPSLVPATVGDGLLDVLDGHRVLVDVQDARGLAGRGAYPPGELGEVVRRVEYVERSLPLAAIDQVVPLGDQIAQRAALVTEGHGAVHAPGPLAPGFLLSPVVVELGVVLHPVDGRALGRGHAGQLDEPRGLTHRRPLPLDRPQPAPPRRACSRGASP